MIIPLTADQIRTFQDTGRLTVELPEPRQPPCKLVPQSDESGWFLKERKYWETMPDEWGGSHGPWKAPCSVGDRVAIATEWYHYPSNPANPANEQAWDPWTRCARWVGGQYLEDCEPDVTEPCYNKRPAEEMPEWSARHHATVAAIDFKRSGDAWIWAVELEADLAD